MTTIPHTGFLSILFLCLTPLHHGAGVKGNTAILRRQDVVVVEHGTLRKVGVPFVSGQSIKNRLRVAGVHYALRAMGVEPESLSKEVVSLLFSGGNLSAKGSGGVDLTRARKMAALAPILSVCGYASGASIDAAKIAVQHAKLICRENAPTLRDFTRAACKPQLRERAGYYTGEEFGTRMEATRDPQIRAFLAPAEVKRIEGAVSARDTKEKKESDQMIYNMEVLLQGSMLEGGVHYTNLSDLEMAALQSAFEEAFTGEVADPLAPKDGAPVQEGVDDVRLGRGFVMSLAAKGNVGFGQVACFMQHDAKIHPAAPQYHPTDALVRSKDAGASSLGADRMAAYHQHLHANRADILDFLQASV